MFDRGALGVARRGAQQVVQSAALGIAESGEAGVVEPNTECDGLGDVAILTKHQWGHLAACRRISEEGRRGSRGSLSGDHDEPELKKAGSNRRATKKTDDSKNEVSYLGYSIDGNIVVNGPLTFSAFCNAAEEGRVHADTLFATPEYDAWKRLEEAEDVWQQVQLALRQRQRARDRRDSGVDALTKAAHEHGSPRGLRAK